MMTTRYATRTCRRSVSRTCIVFPTSNLNECGLNESRPCGISSTHHIEKIFYQVFIPWFLRNTVWSKYSCTVSGHVIKKAESCGVFLLAVRLKWLLYFYYNRAEALNLVSPLKNTKRGNNIIKYLRNCLGHVCVGHTYICFFLNSYLPMWWELHLWAGRLFFRVPSLVTSSCFFIFFSLDMPLESLPLQFREIQVKK